MQTKYSSKLMRAFAFASGLVPAVVQAHPGHDGVSGFVSGVQHPLMGWDHLLAMVAIGLWAAQLGGRALWLVPVSFLALLSVGSFFGAALPAFPGTESVILSSVFVVGLFVAMSIRVPLIFSATIAGGFAVFHGFAHGAEAAKEAGLLGYNAGFLLTTALLHAAGIAWVLAAKRAPRFPIARLAGAAIVIAALIAL
jgi:urease accessory protein